MIDKRLAPVFISIIANVMLLWFVIPLVEASFWLYFVIYMAAYVIPLLLICTTQRLCRTDFTAARVDTNYIIFLSASTFLIIAFFNSLSGIIFPIEGEGYTFSVAKLCVAGVLAPILEELFWRMGVFGSLSKYNTVAAALISSLMFAMLHQGQAGLISAFIAGVLYCYLYFRSGSLIPCILLHVTNNVLALLQSVSARVIPTFLLSSITLTIIYGYRTKGTEKNKPDLVWGGGKSILKSPWFYIAVILVIFIRYLFS